MASGNKVFLDTDVVLDHLADRQPFAEYAHRIFGLGEKGELIICVSSVTFSNLYYILRKLKGDSETRVLLGKLKRLVRVRSTGELEIQFALASGFADFEDAIQHFTAKAEGGISAIVTRNKTDYVTSEISVLSSEEFLRKLEPVGE